MLKYSFRVFDNDGNVWFSAIVPKDELFDFVNEYKSQGIIKCFILDDDHE